MQSKFVFSGSQSDLTEITKIDFKMPCGCGILIMKDYEFQATINAEKLGKDDFSIHFAKIWAGTHLIMELNLILQ